MFRLSTASVLPTLNTSMTQDSQSGYGWRTWAKVSLVFATTAGAFLALKTTGSFSLVSSWLKSNSSEADGLTAIPAEV